MAKGRDHEIVRAFETHPKAVPWTNEIELCGHGPSSVVYRHMQPGSQPISIPSYSCGLLHIIT